jgi:hypothetical protein
MTDSRTDPRLETALRQLEVAANNFAVRLIRVTQVRASVAQMERSGIWGWGGFLDCSRIPLCFMRATR